MKPGKNFKGAGAAFFGVGIAFMVVAYTGQLAFLGVGMAFFALSIVFLGKSRQGG
jgi:hypothetical protein